MSKFILYIIIGGVAVATGIAVYLVYEEQQHSAMIIAQKQKQLDIALQEKEVEKKAAESQAQIALQKQQDLEQQKEAAQKNAQIQAKVAAIKEAEQQATLKQQQEQAAQIQAQQQ